MFKYEKYLREFLEQTGEISLEKIGVFTSLEEMIPAENPSLPAYPKISFQFNRKAITTPALLQQIAEKEQKNRVIVSLDTESFLHELRQLVNTGKSVNIIDIGLLQMDKNGEYEFVQKPGAAGKPDNSARKKLIRRDELLSVIPRQQDPDPDQKSTRITLVKLLIILVVVGAAIFGIYRFVHRAKYQPVSSRVVLNADTVAAHSPAGQPAVQQLPQPFTDSVTFKFIFETTADSSRAYSRTATLQADGDPAGLDSVRQDTAMLYRLYVVKKILPADSLRTKDSVARYFQREITLEKL